MVIANWSCTFCYKFFYKCMFCTITKKKSSNSDYSCNKALVLLKLYIQEWLNLLNHGQRVGGFLPGVCTSHWALQNLRVRLRLRQWRTPLESGSSSLTEEAVMTLAAGCTMTAGYNSSQSEVIQKHLLKLCFLWCHIKARDDVACFCFRSCLRVGEIPSVHLTCCPSIVMAVSSFFDYKQRTHCTLPEQISPKSMDHAHGFLNSVWISHSQHLILSLLQSMNFT